LNMCPKCPPHFAQTTSVLLIPKLLSSTNLTAPGFAS
jgi:hypothetical protein